MVEHDEQIGEMLDKLDELGIADNTIVMYSTDNGPRTTPGPTARTRRSAARRTPSGRAAGASRAFMRWPGRSKPGAVFNGIVSHQDMLPTLVAAAGNPDITQKLLAGTRWAARHTRSTSTGTT